MKVAIILSLSLLILITFSSANFTKSDDGKCRALALRGGGTKGAYEVGALKAMAALLDPKEIEYDVVVGVSIGAMNAALLSFFEKGDEAAAIIELERVWTTYLAQDFWDWWPVWNIAAGLWESSFLDTQPLYDFLDTETKNKTFRRKVAFQTVDLNTGKVLVFDENVPQDKLSQSLAASASVPGAFSPVYLDNMVLVDGGLFTNLDLADAIIKCREVVDDDHDIIVDIIMCFDKPASIEEWTLEEAKFKSA